MKLSTSVGFFAALVLVVLSVSNVFAAEYIVKVLPQDDAVSYFYRGGGSGVDVGANPDAAHYYGFPGYVQYLTTNMTFRYDRDYVASIEEYITSATLNLNILEAYGPGAAGRIYHNGSLVATVADGQAPGWFSTDVSSYMYEDYKAGLNYSTFSVGYTGIYDGPSSMLSFSSGEDLVNAPYVKITATPEPVSSALFLLGGGALAVIRRKRA